MGQQSALLTAEVEPMHRIHLELIPPSPGETLVIAGDEAEHALRVKRLEIGEQVELLDGAGTIALSTRVAHDGSLDDAGLHRARRQRRDAELCVRVEQVRVLEPVRPVVEVCSATPKGGRLDEMIDQLAQIGVAAWRPLVCERSVVDPSDTKLARLERVARESSKQCGRAWLLAIRPEITFHEAIQLDQRARTTTRTILADITGSAPDDVVTHPVSIVRVLVGPQGGFTESELASARSAGVEIRRFGPHLMRIETASAVIAGIILSRAITNDD